MVAAVIAKVKDTQTSSISINFHFELARIFN